MRNAQQREKCKQIIRNVIQRETEILDGTEFIMITDRNGNAFYVSEGYFHMLGYTPNEVEDTSMWNYVHHADVSATKALYSKMAETNQKTSSCLRLHHKNGEWVRICSDRVPIIDDDEIKGYVVVSNQCVCISKKLLLKLFNNEELIALLSSE